MLTTSQTPTILIRSETLRCTTLHIGASSEGWKDGARDQRFGHAVLDQQSHLVADASSASMAAEHEFGAPGDEYNDNERFAAAPAALTLKLPPRRRNSLSVAITPPHLAYRALPLALRFIAEALPRSLATTAKRRKGQTARDALALNGDKRKEKDADAVNAADFAHMEAAYSRVHQIFLGVYNVMLTITNM